MADDSELFNTEEWEEIRKSKKRRTEVAAFRKWTLENLNSRYCLDENSDVKESNCKGDLRILVFGKVGVGKSATANTILGKRRFNESMSPEAVTKRCRNASIKIDGRNIHVIDTPGLEDLIRSNEDALQAISTILAKFSKGIHAFVYVCNLACPRFTDEDYRSLSAFEQRFGGEAKKHRLVVYTHAECLPKKMSLDTFCERQKESQSTIAPFLEDVGSNIVAVNNASDIPAERKRNQREIIAMIDRMTEVNGYSTYTSDMINEANKMRADLMRRLSGQNIDPKVIETVIDVIFEDPSYEFDIGLLKKKVEATLEEELVQLRKSVSQITLHNVKEELDKIDETFQKKRKRQAAEKIKVEAKAEIKSTEKALASKDMERQVETVTTGHGGFFNNLRNYVQNIWQGLKLWY